MSFLIAIRDIAIGLRSSYYLLYISSDNLLGLKENVIIGRLIPAGTGLNEHRNLLVSSANVKKPSEIEEENPQNEELISSEESI